MKIDFIKLKKCPLCKSEKQELLLSTDKFRHGLNTVLCNNCMLVYTNPMPSEHFLSSFYEKSYRKFYTTYNKPSALYIKRLGRDVRAKYHADFLSHNLDLKSLNNVIDIGAAEGSLLNAIKKVCPDSTNFIGIEPGEKFSKFGLDNNYYEKTLKSLDELFVKSNTKNLITIVHVLEHIFNPFEFLSMLHDKLNIGDSLFIDVPNIYEYEKISEIHIAHLYHFNKNTLSEFVAKSGFKISIVEEHTPPRHPKSIRLLCEKVSYNAGTFESFLDNSNSVKNKLMVAINKIKKSEAEYFSFSSKLKRFLKRRLSFLKRLYESIKI